MPEGHQEYSVPEIKWFEGGKLNVAYNCVDRHVEAGRGDKLPSISRANPAIVKLSHTPNCSDASPVPPTVCLNSACVKGDRVVIYLPVIPETIIFTLACARIGAIHSLVFGGFSAEALKFRVEDTGAKVLITTDGRTAAARSCP